MGSYLDLGKCVRRAIPQRLVWEVMLSKVTSNYLEHRTCGLIFHMV
jgi:hypothetical protein